jgi:hypothetical protein
MNKGESHGVHRADCQRSDLRIVIRPIRSRRFQSANGSAAAPLKPVITHYKRRGTKNEIKTHPDGELLNSLSEIIRRISKTAIRIETAKITQRDLPGIRTKSNELSFAHA